MTTSPATSCARNLPQHFNGCTCTAAPGSVTAEAAPLDLGAMMRRDAGIDDAEPAYSQIVAEGSAWEDLQYAEVGVVLREAELAEVESKPFVWRRKKRVAALTADVETARERVRVASRKHRHERESLDTMRPDDRVGAAEREVEIAARHADIARVAYGLSRKDLALAETGKQRHYNQMVVRHFADVTQNAHEYLAAASTDVGRARRSAMASKSPTDGTSLFDGPHQPVSGD
jgi:hypothetical protein